MTGRVIGTNAESGEVELDAAAVPGFMEAMVMPYKLQNPRDLKQLHRGDRIRGTLNVGGMATTLDQVAVTDRSKEIKELGPEAADRSIPRGAPVPEFALIDQNGRTVRMSNFKGKLLLITFVYTNCPLSDYCPRMSHNFADIDKGLAASPEVYNRTHLLTVSFDPDRDTPAVLRSYGGAYTGRYTQENFEHWTFAVPKKEDLEPVLSFFNVGAVPAPGGTLTHTLSTVLIGENGRVLQSYPGNQWTPAQVLADIRRSLGA